MLSVGQIHRLASYFDALDRSLVEGLADRYPTDEREVTRRLAQLLHDPSKWYANVSVSSAWPKTERDPYLAIEVRLHPTGWENEITYSDYGLVVTFEDEVLARGPQTAAYLIQAKRLYDHDGEPPYDLQAQFRAGNEGQRLSLRHLEDHLGENTVKSASYCPRLSVFDKNSIAIVRQLHQENAGALYVGTPFGQELQRNVSDASSTASEAGFWISPVSPRLSRAVDLHRTAFLRSLPFGWFLIANLWTLATVGSGPSRGPVPSAPHVVPWISPGTPHDLRLNIACEPKRQQLILGLARGELDAAKELAKISGDKVPASRFRPAATVEIRITRTIAPELRLPLDHDPDDGLRL
ncbi:hypothetical protein XH89_15850 [Bradyrhizobium sp. CCBAU 53340]|uniref:hypothetical protein n=1 Tax=Bradyrhizobium sp. CCBAU 53340 TaxID=1325112 RepID=UPI00188BECCE|nr:hypothetical protein [Bradyrhizobium sp. CCBAU 53340]QOZ44784.1 hypothetical protein XH89_15850 [Bradyrhizobium sp. CCBAU 53340]